LSYINGISSNLMRVSGLASGLDTESIIQKLMDAERIPLDKLYQKKQLLEWKKDDYRDITNLLRGFKDEFFDLLKPASNMTSSSVYKSYSVSSSDDSVVTATANADAAEIQHSITQIRSLAQAATVSSSSGVILNITGSAAADTDFSDGNNQITLTLDGISRTVAVQAIDYAGDYNLLKSDLETAINTAFGAGKISVTHAAGVFSFAATNSELVLSSASTDNALDHFELSNTTNRIDLSEDLATLATKIPGLTFNASGELEFIINDETFTFDKDTDSLQDVISAVNTNSVAGVTMTYSEATGVFSLIAKQKGSGSTLEFENTEGTLFGAANALKIDSAAIVAGTDAIFTLDGYELTRTDNTVTVDGVTYTLLSEFNDPLDPTQEVTITPTLDVDAVYDNIEAFVNKYNDVIEKINNELTEKKYSDYPPLTDEQKKEMTEDDITLWEEKARSGLLRSDTILQSMTQKMRMAFSDSISGVAGTLADIGVETSSNYLDYGKLVIDETALKEAIRTNPDKVQNLFAKKSTTASTYSATLTQEERQARYDEEGFVNRLYDIIQDNIRASKDNNGQKGTLLEKAGVIGDITEFQNLMDTDIDNNDDAISDLIEKLKSKEDRYYRQFTALEKYISQMNNQSAWLAQQFGGGQ